MFFTFPYMSLNSPKFSLEILNMFLDFRYNLAFSLMYMGGLIPWFRSPLNQIPRNKRTNIVGPSTDSKTISWFAPRIIPKAGGEDEVDRRWESRGIWKTGAHVHNSEHKNPKTHNMKFFMCCLNWPPDRTRGILGWSNGWSNWVEPT